MSAKYLIIDSKDINNVQFQDLCESDITKVRWNNAHTRFVVKTKQGMIPRWYIGKPIYNTNQIRSITSTSNW